jgi:cell division protein FtsX
VRDSKEWATRDSARFGRDDMFLLKLATRPWKTALMSQLFSAVAVGLMLMMICFFFWLERAMRPLAHTLKNEQVLTAYLDPKLNKEQETKVVDQIRMVLGAHAQNTEVELVRSEKFLDLVKAHYPSLGSELENLGSEINQIIPKYISVSGVFPSAAAEGIKGVSGVEAVESSKDRHKQALNAIHAISLVAKLFVFGLSLALLTGVIHLGRTNAFLHRESVSVLKLWGASSFAMMMPNILSGLWVGTLGGLIGMVGWLFGAPWFVAHVQELSSLLRRLPPPELGFAAALVLVSGMILGIVAGLANDRTE